MRFSPGGSSKVPRLESVLFVLDSKFSFFAIYNQKSLVSGDKPAPDVHWTLNGQLSPPPPSQPEIFNSPKFRNSLKSSDYYLPAARGPLLYP